MSQDKPELCGAWAEDGFCTMPKGHNMGRLDIPSNHKSEPVAAQEPIVWACYAKDKLVEVTNNTEYVHTFKCNFPLTHRIVPLYDHAAPCADPIAWRNIASPNGIRRFMTQKQYDANPNLQKYYEPFTCARCAELDKFPSKELTWLYTHCRAIGMTCKSLSGKWEEDIALYTANQQTKIAEQDEELCIVRANEAQLEKDFDRRNEKLAKADAVILKCKEAMTWDIGGEPLPTLEIAALAAIEQYQKGE